MFIQMDLLIVNIHTFVSINRNPIIINQYAKYWLIILRYFEVHKIINNTYPFFFLLTVAPCLEKHKRNKWGKNIYTKCYYPMADKAPVLLITYARHHRYAFETKSIKIIHEGFSFD